MSATNSKFKDCLAELAEGIPAGGLTPALFRDLLSGLKDSLNGAGLTCVGAFILASEERAPFSSMKKSSIASNALERRRG